MPDAIDSHGFLVQRQQMVQSQLRLRGIRDERLLEVMSRVPRDEFVAEEYKDQAYGDFPIPIGEGQTISQPYIVALTIEELQLSPDSKVLEIGTGSGYQTAILAELSGQVYSLERLSNLKLQAERTLLRLNCKNVVLGVGDGSEGWPEHAPYDAIAVSAAAPEIPEPLIEQLAEGGRMIIPVGPPEAQKLEFVYKQNNQLRIRHLEGCRFVPLIGSQAYPRA